MNLGAPGGVRTKVAIPADATPGARVPAPIPKQAVGRAEITVAEFPSMVVDPVAGADLRVPGSADGILTKPNEHQLVAVPRRRRASGWLWRCSPGGPVRRSTR